MIDAVSESSRIILGMFPELQDLQDALDVEQAEPILAAE